MLKYKHTHALSQLTPGRRNLSLSLSLSLVSLSLSLSLTFSLFASNLSLSLAMNHANYTLKDFSKFLDFASFAIWVDFFFNYFCLYSTLHI